MNARAFFILTFEELRLSARSRWLIASWVVFTVAIWPSILLGQRNFNAQSADYADQVQSRLQVQLRGTGRALGRALEPGLRVIRPPSQRTILVEGDDHALPAGWDAAPAGLEALPPYTANSRSGDKGGIWDFEALVRLLGGVIALALGVGRGTRDRASNWLEALRTLPVAPSVAVLARIAGGCMTLTFFVALSWGILTMFLSTISWSEHQSLVQVWLLAIPVLLYLWALLGIGTGLAWALRGSGQAVLGGLISWLVLALLGPAAIQVAAQLVDELPSRSQMERDRREQFADATSQIEKVISQRLVPRGVSLAEPRDLDRLATEEFHRLDADWQKAVRAARQQTDRVEFEWQRHVESHVRLISTAEWLCVGALLRNSMAEFLGTGRATTRRWQEAVLHYQVSLQNALFDNRPVVNLRVPFHDNDQYMNLPRHTPPRFGELPLFDPPIQSGPVDARPPVIGLLLWAMLCLSSSFAFGTKAVRAI